MIRHPGILGRRIYTADGTLERVDWTWPDTALATLNSGLIERHYPTWRVRPGALFRVGPWQVRAVKEDFTMDAWIVARNTPRGLQALAWAWAWAWADLVYRRSVLTLAIWRLADIPPAALPSWRHIRGLGPLVDRLKRIQGWT